MNTENLENKLITQFRGFVNVREEAIRLDQETSYQAALLIDKFGLAILQTLMTLEIRFPRLERVIRETPALIDTNYSENTKLRYAGKLKGLYQNDEYQQQKQDQ